MAALVLVAALAGSAAAGGRMRWTPTDGITPKDLSRPSDYYIVTLNGSGAVGPACGDPAATMAYRRGDALLYEGPNDCWAPWLNGLRSGLGAAADINALHDRCSPPFEICETYLSFKAATAIRGLGRVQPQDVVVGQWDDTSIDAYKDFQLVFDGSDVGLTRAGEKIDALEVFDPGDEPAELDCTHLLLISTAGAYQVADAWGAPLRGGGEDVLGFCASQLGRATTGYWFRYHDGAAEGLPANALIGLDHEDGRRAFARFEFMTNGAIDVDKAQGNHSEVFNFFGQTGQYAGPTFSFPATTAITHQIDSFTVHR
jgi:hypothetical protein